MANGPTRAKERVIGNPAAQEEKAKGRKTNGRKAQEKAHRKAQAKEEEKEEERPKGHATTAARQGTCGENAGAHRKKVEKGYGHVKRKKRNGTKEPSQKKKERTKVKEKPCAC